MRIDIPPDLQEQLQNVGDRMRRRVTPSSPPSTPAPARELKPVGDKDFQHLFQNVYDGAVLTDMDGTVMDANIRVSDFLKYSRHELCGMTLPDVISGADTSIMATLKSSMTTNRFVLIQAYCMRKDGYLFPAEIAINSLKVKGQSYFCCFIRDITWRRQAEEMLRTINNAFQNSSTGIAIADPSGRIEYANLAMAALWNAENADVMKGKTLDELLPDQDQARDLVATVSAGGNWSGDTTLIRPDSAPLHIRVAAAPNRDTEENFAGIVLSFLDITSARRAEEAEKHAERQRVMVESIGAACHHLGQPATVLLASLELMSRMRASKSEPEDELLRSSVEAAESLRQMLHNLNAISEYRTTSYIEPQGDGGYSAPRILAIEPSGN